MLLPVQSHDCHRPEEKTALPELAPHAAMLRQYLFVLGAPGDRLEDLVQDVFVLVLQRGIEDRGYGPVGGFLRGVAKNLLLRDRRSIASRREVELADQVWHEQCEADEGQARLLALRQCIAALPARSRALLARCYDEGAGRRVLGAEFDLLAEGVKTALRRLRAALRQCVQRRIGGGR